MLKHFLEDIQDIEHVISSVNNWCDTAGGRGSRMGGQDKGLVLLSGKPLYQHILHACNPKLAKYSSM